MGRTCWGQLRLYPTNSEVENSGYSAGWLLPFRRPKSSRLFGQSRCRNLGEICSGNAGSFCPRSHDLISPTIEAEIRLALSAWFRRSNLMQSTRLIRGASRVVSSRRPTPWFAPSWASVTVLISDAISPLFAAVETASDLRCV